VPAGGQDGGWVPNASLSHSSSVDVPTLELLLDVDLVGLSGAWVAVTVVVAVTVTVG